MSWHDLDHYSELLARTSRAAGECGSILCQFNDELRSARRESLAAALSAGMGVVACQYLLMAGNDGEGLSVDIEQFSLAFFVTSATELANASGQPVDLQQAHLLTLMQELTTLLQERSITNDASVYYDKQFRILGRWIVERAGLVSVSDYVCNLLGCAVVNSARSLGESYNLG